MAEELKNIETKNIDHLGLVAGVCEEIGLIALIDKLTQSDEQRTVSVGTATQAMILNGLGFTNRTLYLTPNFFKDKAIDVLLGDDISANDLNSHSLGTALDRLWEWGLSRIFFNVALKAIKTYGIAINSRHLDGTTFMVHGNSYAEGGELIGQIELNRGYNKQKRNDLRQFVVEMISANVEGIPLFMKTASGNKTDKTEFPDVLEAYVAQMKEADEDMSGYTVADSALYSEENLDRLQAIKWISRVPETLKQAKSELRAYATRSWKNFEDASGYKYAEVSSSYGGLAQRWLIVWSAQAEKRSTKTVSKQVSKEKANLEKGIKGLKKTAYSTEQQAEQAVQDWYGKQLKKSQKRYHSLGKLSIVQRAHWGRGRRKANAVPLRVDYQLKSVELIEDESVVKDTIRQKAQFILATNDTNKDNLSVDE